MKKLRLIYKLSLLAALFAFLFLLFITQSSVSDEKLSIWYVAEDMDGNALDILLDKRIKSIALLSVRSFKDYDAMLSALEREQPELIWCSHSRAYELSQAMTLNSSPLTELSFLPYVSGLDGVGSYLCPIGASLPVIAYNTSIMSEPPNSLEDLVAIGNEYSKRTGKPFFSAESYALLFASSLASLGTDFHASLSLNAEQPYYRMLHNLLCESAYGFAAVSAEAPALDKLLDGTIACACLPSSGLRHALPEGFAICPLPIPEEGIERYAAELVGFAIMKSDEQTLNTIAKLLERMQKSSSAASLALSCGLSPVDAYKKGKGRDELSTILITARDRDTLYYLPPDSDYMQNRMNHEKAFRLSLELLS